MSKTIRTHVAKQIQRKRIRPKEGVKLIDFYEKCLNDYTYLKN